MRNGVNAFCRSGRVPFMYEYGFESFVIWYIHFSRNSRTVPEPDINPRGLLHPEAGSGLHILVTGGAGFIGSHAVMVLAGAGHAVTVLDNLSRGNAGALRALRDMIPARRFRFLRVDLGDRATLCSALATSSPPLDLVMHFAAVAYVGESMRDPLQYYKNVTVNTVNLLDCMAANGIKKLVYSSTCAVYGNPEKLPVTEQTPPVPINPYGQSKLMAEEPDFKAIILRYFNVYGSDPLGRLGEYPRPELRSQSRISGACMDAALGLVGHLTVKGTRHPTEDGTCVRDYIHVMDLISAHEVAMRHLANPPPLYNIGTGKGVSVKQFVEACRRVTQRDITVVYQEEARPGDYAAVWSDVSKINRELGWRANYTDIEEGLRHAWQWRVKHPHGYAQ
ncbi:hypothetical protein VOLCADRAFT_87343 [Volvox carteri f. nagariensis]|uniref:NAD-dependent epimerase/dehydratase domain-containing protein n=1 Tax=Volvox carteri f. nagariensis TaxID=3068 RepID=D8TL36_VOLCA|nr:uncharacterized protein VOLCADRAFT_87343 [Volvox carteri f. nagariensis]EFJ51669.1 hypothetical protein VOLCADRAFT_87343 [Volvox carteri f. nagariensis]|eukprot:XP_002947079.1 hypothetical protein VOLCADRAFT_87343 [Volvox carteri f. nagariensis]